VRITILHVFLPQWFANRIFPICGTAYGVALLLIVVRLLR